MQGALLPLYKTYQLMVHTSKDRRGLSRPRVPTAAVLRKLS